MSNTGVSSVTKVDMTLVDRSLQFESHLVKETFQDETLTALVLHHAQPSVANKDYMAADGKKFRTVREVYNHSLAGQLVPQAQYPMHLRFPGRLAAGQ